MKRGYIEHRFTYDINKTLGRNPKDMFSAQYRSLICAICIYTINLPHWISKLLPFPYIYIYITMHDLAL